MGRKRRNEGEYVRLKSRPDAEVISDGRFPLSKVFFCLCLSSVPSVVSAFIVRGIFFVSPTQTEYRRCARLSESAADALEIVGLSGPGAIALRAPADVTRDLHRIM